MEEKIYNIIMECLHIHERSEIQLNDDFIDDLGANSGHMAEIIMMVEAEFDIMIEDKKSKRLTTIKKIVNYLQKNSK